LFFLHCLHRDHAIPINQLYDEDGFKSLPTQRFHEVIKTIETSFKPCDSSSDNEFSFYTEDSYELIDVKVTNTPKRRVKVPALDLSVLPDYVSSDDEHV
jgi:hypothetical protein